MAVGKLAPFKSKLNKNLRVFWIMRSIRGFNPD